MRLCAVLVGVGLLAGCKSAPAPQANDRLLQSETWCPDGFEVGPQDTCFAIPDAHDKSTPVLVYLHGMFAGHGSPAQWAMLREATRRGFAVVIPRGKRGLCAWKAELKDHFCWPQEIDDPRAFKSIVAEWDRVLWQVDALLEGGAHKRYVLGLANGGSFAEYLAARGIFAADSYAIVSGPALVPPAPHAKVPPLLLLSSEDDPELGKAGWAHAWCPRAAAPDLTSADVDAALRFFQPQNGAFACEGGPTKAAPPGVAPKLPR